MLCVLRNSPVDTLSIQTWHLRAPLPHLDLQRCAHTCASYVYQVLIRSGQVAGSALYNVTTTSAWPTRNGEIEEGGEIGVGTVAACVDELDK